MFVAPIIDGRALWLVVFAFYLLDNFCLIDEKQIVVLENYRLRWSFRFSSIPFVISKRPLYFLQPFTPYAFAFKMPWQTGNANALSELTHKRRRLAVWRSRLISLRVLSSIAFLNLFLIGPCLTISNNLIFALLVAGPIHIAVLICVIERLLTHRQLLEYNDKTLWSLIAEISLCPGYLPHICRRVSLSFRSKDVDGVVFLLRFGQPVTAEKLREALRFRKSEHQANDETDSEIEQYFAEIGL